MNNWRLLLLAVIAVLQPVPSFTERNLIDGRQECCDHRTNSVIPDTRLHGTYRKYTAEERRLNTRVEISEERRYETRHDSLAPARERLVSERAERRISSDTSVRPRVESRFTRDQERRHRISSEARDSKQTRNHQNRRTRESLPRKILTQYEDGVSGSRRTRMSRDNTRLGRMDNEQFYRSPDSRETERVRNVDGIHLISPKKETIAVFKRESDNIARDVIRRDSRINTVRSMLELDNSESRTLDGRARNGAKSGLSQSQESRVNRFVEREDFRSRHASREDRRSKFRTSRERIDEQRQRDWESSDRIINVRRDPSKRMSMDQTHEYRDTVEQVGRVRGDIREIQIKKFNDESTLTIERRRASVAPARRSLILRAINRSERIVRSDDRTNVLKNASRRGENTRVSRISEATNRGERYARNHERRDDRRESSTRSLDQVSVQRLYRDSRSLEREHLSYVSARSQERNIRDETRQQRESRNFRDQTIAKLRESRESSELRQETRIETPKQFKTRTEQNSRTHEDLKDSRADMNQRQSEERRVFRKQTLRRMSRSTDRTQDHEPARNYRLAQRVSSFDRVIRNREVIRSNERLEMRREARHENQDSRDRSVPMQRITRDIATPQRRYITLMTSRAGENARAVRSRTLEDIRDNERREVLRERDEIRVSRDRISATRLSRDRTEEQRQDTRGSRRNARDDVRNEITRSREDMRMSERFESRRQQDESRVSKVRLSQRQSRDILAERSVDQRSRDVTSRNMELRIRYEGSSVNRDGRRINVLQVRNDNRQFSAMEAKLRSSDIRAKDVRMDDRDMERENSKARFRNFDSPKVREIDPVEETPEYRNVITWQMVFYTLQGAYLCGLLMQMLTEKPNKGKSRNYSWWSSRNLVKVD